MNTSDPGVTRILGNIEGWPHLSKESCWNFKGTTWAQQKRPRISFKGKSWVAARLFYKLFSEKAFDPNLLVLHKCKSWRCCNPEHLYQGTAQDNMNDACNARLNGFKVPPAEARAIREGKYSRLEAMQKFDITSATFYNIKSGYYRANT